LWEPFTHLPFPSHFHDFFGEVFPSLETQINWRETPTAHVFKAVLPGLTRDDVIIFVDDDNMLQISTEDGKFMSKFKLPGNAKVDQVTATMVNGVLRVTVAKEVPQRPNSRVVEISG
ncbi:HSP20 domain-containing protein, partial [Cephalotus follicularis]